jgi:hypothetical protein
MTKEQADRQHLLSFNRERLGQAYRTACVAGMTRPVVLVLDVRDDLAQAVAGGVVSDEEVELLILETAPKKGIPTVVFAAPLESAVHALAEHSPKTSRALTGPLPTGHFVALAIAGRGTLCAGLPIPGEGA